MIRTLLPAYFLALMLFIGGIALRLFDYRMASWIEMRTAPTSDYWQHAIADVGVITACFGALFLLLVIHHHLRASLTSQQVSPARGFEPLTKSRWE
jgi:hypothetical protein